MQNEIKQTWHFKQSPQDVWEYLTKPELLEQWLMKSDFQPLQGHRFRFISPSGIEHYCEVLEIKPYTQLSYSWQRKSAKDGNPFDSKVMWTLTPKDNGTELQLVHDGFTAIEDYTQHEKGWAMLVPRMAELLNARVNDTANV